MMSQVGLVNVAIILACILLAIAGVWVRLRTDGKVEVKLTDLLVGVVPIVIWLVASGQIGEAKLGPDGFELKAAQALNTAARQPIQAQVQAVKLEQQAIEMAPKMGTDAIPGLIERKIDSLSFTLGRAIYDSNATREYLRRLTEVSSFRYVVINQQNGALAAIFDARQFTGVLEQSRDGWQRFTESMNRGDLSFLQGLPGFISVERAVPTQVDKREALRRLEEAQANWLPVVDEKRQLTGIVDRSRITASLLLDVANTLADEKTKR